MGLQVVQARDNPVDRKGDRKAVDGHAGVGKGLLDRAGQVGGMARGDVGGDLRGPGGPRDAGPIPETPPHQHDPVARPRRPVVDEYPPKARGTTRCHAMVFVEQVLIGGQTVQVGVHAGQVETTVRNDLIPMPHQVRLGHGRDPGQVGFGHGGRIDVRQPPAIPGGPFPGDPQEFPQAPLPLLVQPGRGPSEPTHVLGKERAEFRDVLGTYFLVGCHG